MKYLIFLLLPIVGMTQTACPPKGDGANSKEIAADLLKNRSYCPPKYKAHGYDISVLMKDAITDTSLVYVDAYITSVKISGVESCECHIENNDYKDYHIYIAQTMTQDKGKNQIVEVSRYSRQFNPKMSFQNIKALVGKKVRIYGYTFMDQEHKGAIGDWRAGIQEIHPVFYIEAL